MRLQKHHHLVLAAALLAASLAGTSCSKDSISGRSVFRFAAGTSRMGTKTSYSGEGTVSGGRLVQERIDWMDTDLIRIYSPEAILAGDDATHYADYDIVDPRKLDDVTSRAKITPAGAALEKGEDGVYHFYASYPSPATTGMPSGVALDLAGGDETTPAVVTFTGVVPDSQTEYAPAVAGSYVYQPDMRWAYMLATGSANLPADEGEEVYLTFTPKFSAFEFTVSSGEYASVTLRSMSLTAASGSLSGTFQIRAGDFGAITAAIPAADITDAGPTVTVDFGTDGIVLTQAHPVTLSLIALAQDVSGLTVSFTGDEIGTRSLDLTEKLPGATDYTPITFGPYSKHRIKGLRFPTLTDVIIVDPIIWDGEYWSSAFADNISWDGDYTGGVSIPGGDPIGWESQSSGSATINDPIDWTTDAGMNGPFGGLYLSKGYLTKSGSSLSISGDDPLEILRYYGSETSSSAPRHYLQAAEAAGVEGFTVPTQAQWASILGTTRPGASVNYEAGKHYAKVTVDLTGTEYASFGASVQGLLLFPDGAELFIAELLDAALDDPADAFSASLTAARLQYLCGGAKGCAFLPCAGSYSGSAWTGGGSAGYFLPAAQFDAAGISATALSGAYYSVRLVK